LVDERLDQPEGVRADAGEVIGGEPEVVRDVHRVDVTVNASVAATVDVAATT
jgi:hypothetical protein